jgi:hypothetical protein
MVKNIYVHSLNMRQNCSWCKNKLHLQVLAGNQVEDLTNGMNIIINFGHKNEGKKYMSFFL